MQCEYINYITVCKILSPNNQFGCYMCVCTVYWLVTMARYLLTARQAQGRPSPSLEGRSITVTVALFHALFLIYMSALTRYLSISTDRKLQITQVQYFTADNLHRHSTHILPHRFWEPETSQYIWQPRLPCCHSFMNALKVFFVFFSWSREIKNKNNHRQKKQRWKKETTNGKCHWSKTGQLSKTEINKSQRKKERSKNKDNRHTGSHWTAILTIYLIVPTWKFLYIIRAQAYTLMLHHIQRNNTFE